MADLYKQHLLHGESHKKTPAKKQEKDRFSIAIEHDIDRYLDTQSFEGSQLLSPELKRAKMKSEMLEAVQLSELNQQIELALTLLKNEGLKILGKETYESMLENLVSAANTFGSMDLSQEPTETFGKLLGFSDLTMQACSTIANAKFKDAHFTDALALCILMSTLAPQNPYHWYRTGIAAQNAQKYDLALQAYEATAELDPTLYEVWLFAVQCYLSQGLYSEARTAFNKAKEAIQYISLEEHQKKLFSNIEEALKAAHS